MTTFKDMHGTPMILGDTVFFDGHYTVKQNEDGQYYLKSHHKHKTVTPFNEDVLLNEEVASEVYITTKGKN